MRYAILMLLLCPLSAGAQSLPPKLSALPKQTGAWPPAWAALARDLAAGPDDFEKIALERIPKLLDAEPGKESCRRAEALLAATLRHHLSVRRGAPLAENPWKATEADLRNRLATVRQDWLTQLGDDAEALQLADAWLPVTSPNRPPRGAILSLWTRHAKAALDKKDFSAARIWLNRIEANFTDAQAEPIRAPVHARAQALLKEAPTFPEPQASRALEAALELWPRLPEARDALERRKGTYRTLTVGVPVLPTQMSPATAWTEVEKQTLALLFDRLYATDRQASLGRRYRPQLATALPGDMGLTASITLRRDVYWSSGERVTAADIRHTAVLMNKDDLPGRSALWRDFLEIPPFEANTFQLSINYRQGLLDPLAPLDFWVLPQYYRNQQLQSADDAEFARAPVGSGPYQYLGRKQDGNKIYADFQANPYDLRHSTSHVRTLRMTAWTDARKDLAKPLPQMILDAPTTQLAALRELGYVELPGSVAPPVHFLAVNQRKGSLALPAIRRAIAHGLDRQALLNRHFRAGTDKHHASANGLFPRNSWAVCPAPRVPAELFNAEQARSDARKAKPAVAEVQWTLKYAAGDTRVKAACTEMAGTISALLNQAGVKASVQAVGMPTQQIRKTLAQRDFDLLYLSAEHLDDPVRLALLFDPSVEALGAGGSNYLGCEDIKLQELIHAALKHRRFAAAQAGMHAVHVHLNETMPAIPLWQLDLHVLVQLSLRVPRDERQAFGRVRQWLVQ